MVMERKRVMCAVHKFPSLSYGQIYLVEAEDATCYTINNAFGNALRYRKEHFTVVEPKRVSMTFVANIDKILPREVVLLETLPGNGGRKQLNAGQKFEVVDQTDNYYYVKVPYANGDSYVIPLRASLFAPTVMDIGIETYGYSESCESWVAGGSAGGATPPKEEGSSGLHTIAVTFTGNPKQYFYLTRKLPPKGVRYAVVESPSTGYTCVKIAKTYPNAVVSPACKFIVDYTDDSEYVAQIEAKRREFRLRSLGRQLEVQCDKVAAESARMEKLREEYEQLLAESRSSW